jgi:hypothetical protein
MLRFPYPLCVHEDSLCYPTFIMEDFTHLPCPTTLLAVPPFRQAKISAAHSKCTHFKYELQNQ